jgi:hypothetical protein
MHAALKTSHPGRVPSVAASGAGDPSIPRMATMVSAAVIVAFLIGWIVAASLGFGGEGHPNIGPDRPPAPVLVRLHVPVA